MIIHNQDLVNELSKAFKTACKRIWIAVPFIGSWKSIERIMSNNWLLKDDIDIRLITDIRNEQFIASDTFEIFQKHAEVKTLAGLHAKVYIIDDFILLTSANLTDAAFTKRYEIGITLHCDKSVLDIYNEWWLASKPISNDWKHATKSRTSNTEPESSDTSKLKRQWKLPAKKHGKTGFTEYAIIVKTYDEFAKLYSQSTNRLLPSVSLYQEVDAFFNYLFHEHPEKPSNVYQGLPYRKLTKKQRLKEISNYVKLFSKWLRDNPNSESYRTTNIELLQKKLSVQKIDSLNRDDIESVTKCLHCMNSVAIQRYKFLNPQNNDVETIRTQWKNLLHSDIGLEERMAGCDSNLWFFSKSSIRELIAWYYPDKYPIVNVNSNSGMKFFGYDLKTY